MNYQQALERTLRLKNFAQEFNLSDSVRYIVVPKKQNEMTKFLDNNFTFNDDQDFEKCIQFSSDNDFQVYRLELTEKDE